jgi:hypothetical protein
VGRVDLGGGPGPGSIVAREPTDLVPVAEARGPDLYERKFMAGQGMVLHRDKHRAGWPLQAIFGLSMLAMVGSAAASGAWLVLPVALPIVALLWLMFSVLRVTVSAGSVKVQYGLFGPEIPIEAIEAAEATSYDWKRFGGWGIRRGIGGEWIYNMPGDGGRAVRIVWRDAKGRRRVTLIGSPRAEALAAAVQGARVALPASAERKAITDGA